MVIFANTNSNSMEVIISKPLNDSYIGHDEFA